MERELLDKLDRRLHVLTERDDDKRISKRIKKCDLYEVFYIQLYKIHNFDDKDFKMFYPMKTIKVRYNRVYRLINYMCKLKLMEKRRVGNKLKKIQVGLRDRSRHDRIIKML